MYLSKNGESYMFEWKCLGLIGYNWCLLNTPNYYRDITRNTTRGTTAVHSTSCTNSSCAGFEDHGTRKLSKTGQLQKGLEKPHFVPRAITLIIRKVFFHSLIYKWKKRCSVVLSLSKPLIFQKQNAGFGFIQ